MGGKNRSEIKTQITNELSTEINNKTRNINRVTNSSTTELIQNIKSQAEATVDSTIGGSNNTEVNNLTIAAGGRVNLVQSLKINAVQKALIDILTDTSILQNNANDLANKIKNDVANSLQLKQDVEFLAKIGSYSSNNGGPEAIAESLAGVVETWIQSTSGQSNTNITETEVRNLVRTTINNEVINENEVNTKISTSIQNNMSQLANAGCNLRTTAGNNIDIKNLIVGEDALYNNEQIIDISSFTSCIIKLNLASSIVSELTNNFVVDTSSNTDNNQDVDTKAKLSGTIETISEITSSISDAFNNLVNNIGDVVGSWIYIVGGIVGVIILIILASIFIPMMSSGRSSKKNKRYEDEDENDYEQRGGGINGNIYLLASFIAILILIANKSLPLCGVLLIVIILYLVNKKKPELLGLNN
jgi:hypothetical protein